MATEVTGLRGVRCHLSRRWPARPALLLAALLLAALPACAGEAPATAPPTPDSIKARGELRVATLNSPTAYYLGTHGPEGLEFQLASQFARSLGVRLQVVQLASRAALRSALVDGRADIAAAQLTWGPEWQPSGIAAQPYDQVVQYWVYRRGRPKPDGLEDLAEARIVVMEDSAEAAFLQAWSAEANVDLKWVVIPRDGGIDSLDAVGSDTADVALIDGNEFAFARPLHPEVGIAFALPRKRPVQWILPRGAEQLRTVVDAWFERERRSGHLAATRGRALPPPTQMRRLTAREFRGHVEQRLPGLQPLFEQASVQTGVDWRLLAALAYQESQWDARAESPNGARGIMMLMPETAATVGVTDLFDARASILGGAKYFLKVMRQIPARIPEPDRTWFAIASYNMGYGHLEDARVITQMRGGNPDKWAEVSESLPLLSEAAWYLRVKNGYARGWEAQYTVDRVRQFANVLEWRATARHQPDAGALAALESAEAGGVAVLGAAGEPEAEPALQDPPPRSREPGKAPPAVDEPATPTASAVPNPSPRPISASSGISLAGSAARER
jgi:membrane-bound lytic murein transglycosylase F